jgi:hypothetical protein
MDAEQARMVVEPVQAGQADDRGPERKPEIHGAPTGKGGRRGPAWILACVGGGGLLIGAALAWGYWQFGSLASTVAYLNGERVFVDPDTLSLGVVRRGEERDLRFTIRNRTGKAVKLLGAKSTCGCMRMEETFPISIGEGGQRELTIHVWLTGKDSAFDKRVDFYTDEESKPVIAVAVRATLTD